MWFFGTAFVIRNSRNYWWLCYAITHSPLNWLEEFVVPLFHTECLNCWFDSFNTVYNFNFIIIIRISNASMISMTSSQVNSVVETWVNKSLSYLEFSIKRETLYYWVTVTKRVLIPGEWPKTQKRTIVCRYVIVDESEESNQNCKFVADVLFGWWHLCT